MDKEAISHKQEAFILKLVEVGSISGACKDLRLSRQAYYEWIKDEGWKTRLRGLRERVLGDALDTIRQLKDKGQTFREIAETLNREGVKTQRGRWNPGTVHRIYARLLSKGPVLQQAGANA